jgi:hypothetical protein
MKVQKPLLLSILSLTLSSSVFSQDGNFKFEMNEFSKYKALGRSIEGTSPILGYSLTKTLKDSNLHPGHMYHQILKQNKSIRLKLYTSAASYLNIMLPELKDYCNQETIVTDAEDSWEQVERAAIPQEIIEPLTDKYLKQIDLMTLRMNSKDSETIISESKSLGKTFQAQRYSCKTAMKLTEIENKAEKFCLGMGFCLKAKEVNHILSSAEASFPRVQFSINGFTRYVYDQLLVSSTLERDLKIVYDLEARWLKKIKNKETESQLFEYVVDQAVARGMHIKDVLLVLAYSMRNMPSLDIEYTEDPLKALLLESYFWGFKDLRDELSQEQFFQSVFPGHKFKKNPGFYHYLTAALLGCEARLAGLGHISAIGLGLISKVGYKTDKLIKYIDKEHYQNLGTIRKITYIAGIMKYQGYFPGVGAGYHASIYGSKACIGYKRMLKKQYRKKKRSLRRNSSSKEEFKDGKLQLRKDLRKLYKSVLEQGDINDAE